MRSPYLGRADLAVSEETVERRRRRAALGWLSTGVSPPLSHRVARRLLEDGRGDFALSRTLVNWRRLTNAIGSVQPLVRWWKGVQSWQRPWHSARVAVVIVLAANWPSRALALGCLALVTWMVRRKVRGAGRGWGGDLASIQPRHHHQSRALHRLHVRPGEAGRPVWRAPAHAGGLGAGERGDGPHGGGGCRGGGGKRGAGGGRRALPGRAGGGPAGALYAAAGQLHLL